MITSIKNSIARLFIHRKLISLDKSVIMFNKFITRSTDFMVIMPAGEDEFKSALSVIEYLLLKNKNLTVFVPDYRFSMLPHKHGLSVIDYSLDDVTKLNLPGKGLLHRIKTRIFDVTIDLNFEDDVFFNAVAACAVSKFKIGFEKRDSDKYYNFQIPKTENNCDFSYGNLLNSIKMF